MKTKFTNAELKIIQKYNSPEKTQEFLLDEITYDGRNTVSSFRRVVRDKKAHCLEGALTAAAILENHGYPPLILDLKSTDGRDHVLYLYQKNGKYGAIGKSRFPRLMERKPRYESVEELVRTYYAPFMDTPESKIKSFGIANLKNLKVNWRTSERNLWQIGSYIDSVRHKKLRIK